MQVKHLLLGIFALGVTAVANPEAGNDVEARDLAGETLTEFDVRSPEEEELEARGDYTPKCRGHNVDYKQVDYDWKCVCRRSGEYYNKHSGCQCKHGKEYSHKYKKCITKCNKWEEYDHEHDKCYKPFKCKGDYVKVVDNYGQKSCECERSGEVYNKWKGCQCPHGEEYSEHYKKCIPECEYGEEYNGHECAPKCKGDHVVYKHDECKCLKRGQYYDEHEGCKDRCKAGAWYEHGECKCKKGEYYDEHEGCKSICKGDNVFYNRKYNKCQCKHKDQYYKKNVGCVNRCDGDAEYDWHKKECKCDYGKEYVKGTGCVKKCKYPATLEYDTCKCPGDQVYSDRKGCQCPKWGQKYSHKYNKCYSPCTKKHETLVWKWGNAKCVCKDGYERTKWGCQKKKEHGGYY